MKDIENRDYYTTAEAGRIIDVDASTIFRWADKGKIKAYRVGTWWRIRKVDFHKYLKKCGVK